MTEPHTKPAQDRKCRTCIALDRDDAGEAVCLNIGEPVAPGSSCAQHETPAEFDADMAATQLLRRLRRGARHD